ncbi:hypothetical protein B0H14DRAFT_3438924 [Mycena olivaceomarginata]|nr:hypothetical protein B0H14DRAFT_3438924 [Mycena olivaceomarginata]
MSHISENTSIKQSLFPPCGPNVSMAEGGGKPKVVAQWELCVLRFGEDKEFKDAIAAAADVPSERTTWSIRIKNHLCKMAQITRAYITEMGETGAGIQNAAEIDTTQSNAFTNKWGTYLSFTSKSPCTALMRNLIAERPNLIPTGLGYSTVDNEGPDNDEDELTSQASVPLEGWDKSPSPRQSPNPEGSSDDYEPSSPVASELEPVDNGKMAINETKPARKEHKAETKPKAHPAKPRTSKPVVSVPAAALKPSKKTKLAEFSEIVKTEEKTRQKELDLAVLRTCQSIVATEVRGWLAERREERKLEEKKRRWELKMMRTQNTYELHLAGINTAAHSQAAPSQFCIFDGGRDDINLPYTPHLSSYASSEPTTEYSDFSGNAMAGPSTSTTSTEFNGFGSLCHTFPDL